jgi:hypothetical protein
MRLTGSRRQREEQEPKRGGAHIAWQAGLENTITIRGHLTQEAPDPNTVATAGLARETARWPGNRTPARTPSLAIPLGNAERPWPHCHSNPSLATPDPRGP